MKLKIAAITVATIIKITKRSKRSISKERMTNETIYNTWKIT